MHHPTDRIAHTTAFVEHWLEREIAQWVHPMKDRSDDPSHHERTLLPQSYISFPKVVIFVFKYMLKQHCHIIKKQHLLLYELELEKNKSTWGLIKFWVLICFSYIDCSFSVPVKGYGNGMFYPVCSMMHIRYALLLTVKSCLCFGSSRFPFSPSYCPSGFFFLSLMS